MGGLQVDNLTLKKFANKLNAYKKVFEFLKYNILKNADKFYHKTRCFLSSDLNTCFD